MKNSIHFTIMAALLVTVMAVPAVWAEAPDENPFVGKWKVTMTMRDREMTSVLSIQTKDGALAGTWQSPRGTSDLKDVKVTDGKLSFTRAMRGRDGQEFSMKHTAKLQDGKLLGKVQTRRGDREFAAALLKPGEKVAMDRGGRGPRGGREGQRVRGDRGGHGPRGGGEGHGARGGDPSMMLERLDANGDGKLQQDEAPEQLQQFFGMIDQNNDGALDADELETMRQFRGQRGPGGGHGGSGGDSPH